MAARDETLANIDLQCTSLLPGIRYPSCEHRYAEAARVFVEVEGRQELRPAGERRG